MKWSPGQISFSRLQGTFCVLGEKSNLLKRHCSWEQQEAVKMRSHPEALPSWNTNIMHCNSGGVECQWKEVFIVALIFKKAVKSMQQNHRYCFSSTILPSHHNHMLAAANIACRQRGAAASDAALLSSFCFPLQLICFTFRRESSASTLEDINQTSHSAPWRHAAELPNTWKRQRLSAYFFIIYDKLESVWYSL